MPSVDYRDERGPSVYFLPGILTHKAFAFIFHLRFWIIIRKCIIIQQYILPVLPFIILFIYTQLMLSYSVLENKVNINKF